MLTQMQLAEMYEMRPLLTMTFCFKRSDGGPLSPDVRRFYWFPRLSIWRGIGQKILFDCG